MKSKTNQGLFAMAKASTHCAPARSRLRKKSGRGIGLRPEVSQPRLEFSRRRLEFSRILRHGLVLLAATLSGPVTLAHAQPPMLSQPPRRDVAAPRHPATVNESVLAPTPDHEQPEILRSLPRPPNQPASLFDEAMLSGPPTPDFEHPYFQKDPLLDPVDFAQPGWFGDAEVGIIHPYVNYPTQENVPLGSNPNNVVQLQLGTAHLNWAAAPRVSIGYRLPSGFGEFLVSDRYFNARGSDTTLTANGPASRQTEFMLNYTDIDYASRELTPYTGWSLRFQAGIRVAQTYLGTRVDQSLVQAAAGDGIFAGRQTNHDRGVGPHFGVQIDRHFKRSGLTWVNQVDVSTIFTHVRQESFVGAIGPGGIQTGDVITKFTQNMPVLSVQIGLNWQPPRLPNSKLYVGYIGQFWYLFGTNSDVGAGPFGQPIYTNFQYEGVVLQWSWNL